MFGKSTTAFFYLGKFFTCSECVFFTYAKQFSDACAHIVLYRCVVSTISVCVAISLMLKRYPEYYKDGVYNVDKIIEEVIKRAKLHMAEDGWVGT